MSKPVIAVIFYSTYGHIATLAEAVIKGAEATGAVVKPYVFQETLPEEVLTKMHAGSSLKPKYPVITPDALKEADGFIIGAPTRYGRLPAQVDTFFDSTGGLWATGALVGKAATMFTSVAGQHSGHESTFVTTFPFFAHHGIVYVPIGYSDPSLATIADVQGGSPYGASTLAGSDGSRQPTAHELGIAEHQGKYFSNYVAQVVRGKHLLASDGEKAKSAAAAPAASSGTTSSSTGAAVAGGAAATGVAGSAAAYALGKPVDAKTGAASTEAAPATTTTSAATKDAANSIPAEVANKKEGYTVPEDKVVKESTTTATDSAATTTDKATTAAAATGATAAGATGAAGAAAASTPAAATSAAAPANEKATPAAAKPAATPATTQKKKGGLFSCCNGSGIDH